MTASAFVIADPSSRSPSMWRAARRSSPFLAVKNSRRAMSSLIVTRAAGRGAAPVWSRQVPALPAGRSAWRTSDYVPPASPVMVNTIAWPSTAGTSR
jgi:hypothetical protein